MRQWVRLFEVLQNPEKYGIAGEMSEKHIKYVADEAEIILKPELTGWDEEQKVKTKLIEDWSLCIPEKTSKDMFLVAREITDYEVIISGKQGYTKFTEMLIEHNKVYESAELKTESAPMPNYKNFFAASHLPCPKMESSSKSYYGGEYTGVRANVLDYGVVCVYQHKIDNKPVFQEETLRYDSTKASIRPVVHLPTNIKILVGDPCFDGSTAEKAFKIAVNPQEDEIEKLQNYVIECIKKREESHKPKWISIYELCQNGELWERYKRAIRKNGIDYRPDVSSIVLKAKTAIEIADRPHQDYKNNWCYDYYWYSQIVETEKEHIWYPMKHENEIYLRADNVGMDLLRIPSGIQGVECLEQFASLYGNARLKATGVTFQQSFHWKRGGAWVGELPIRLERHVLVTNPIDPEMTGAVLVIEEDYDDFCSPKCSLYLGSQTPGAERRVFEGDSWYLCPMVHLSKDTLIDVGDIESGRPMKLAIGHFENGKVILEEEETPKVDKVALQETLNKIEAEISALMSKVTIEQADSRILDLIETMQILKSKTI